MKIEEIQYLYNMFFSEISKQNNDYSDTLDFGRVWVREVTEGKIQIIQSALSLGYCVKSRKRKLLKNDSRYYLYKFFQIEMVRILFEVIEDILRRYVRVFIRTTVRVIR